MLSYSPMSQSQGKSVHVCRNQRQTRFHTLSLIHLSISELTQIHSVSHSLSKNYSYYSSIITTLHNHWLCVGVTVQRITGYRVSAESLRDANSRLYGIKVGNFQYVQQPLRLGDHKGNYFTITVRSVSEWKLIWVRLEWASIRMSIWMTVRDQLLTSG